MQSPFFPHPFYLCYSSPSRDASAHFLATSRILQVPLHRYAHLTCLPLTTTCTCCVHSSTMVRPAQGGAPEERRTMARARPDEDIATLDTPTLWSFPSCNSSPTQLSRHPRIQQTRRHCFGHNSLIRHRNRAFLDALERGPRRRRFGSGPGSRRTVDHSV
jgi:hypothetical protein